MKFLAPPTPTALSADPSASPAGSIYYNTTTGLKWSDGTVWRTGLDIESAQTISGTKTFSAVTIATLTLTNPLAQSSTHASPDTDTSASALHHTLGLGANQAAPGNHGHTVVGAVDTRAAATTPGDYVANVKWQFKRSDTLGLPGGTSSSYASLEGWRTYSDNTGDRSNEIAYWGADVYRRYAVDNATWTPWTKMPVDDSLLAHLAGTETFTGTKTFGAATIGTLTLTNPLAQASTHASPDTDVSTSSLHHTIGTGANQAAAGNHTHAASAITSGLLAIAQGGTNSSATPTAGGVGYGTGTAHAFTGSGSLGQYLKSNGASPPTWADLPTGGGGGGANLVVASTNPNLTSPGLWVETDPITGDIVTFWVEDGVPA